MPYLDPWRLSRALTEVLDLFTDQEAVGQESRVLSASLVKTLAMEPTWQ